METKPKDPLLVVRSREDAMDRAFAATRYAYEADYMVDEDAAGELVLVVDAEGDTVCTAATPEAAKYIVECLNLAAELYGHF